MTREDILQLIKEDRWMMYVLKTVRELNLPDWWIGAGFVRSKVWDKLHGYTTHTPLPDIDVIYFDKNDFTTSETGKETTQAEKKYETLLKKIRPELGWSVVNQARMHIFHNDPPYASSEEALSHWIETATCIAVRLDENSNIILSAPLGINDLTHLILRPNGKKNVEMFKKRILQKEWPRKWPKLQVII